jgi:hypothetical protein
MLLPQEERMYRGKDAESKGSRKTKTVVHECSWLTSAKQKREERLEAPFPLGDQNCFSGRGAYSEARAFSASSS